MRWIAPLLTGLAAALIGFYAMLHAVPGFIMSRADARFDSLGVGANTAYHSPAITEESRSVVRPSPDLLYSVCVFDLSEGPVSIAAPWPEDGRYASVSFYDARTNNFAVVNDGDAWPAMDLVRAPLIDLDQDLRQGAIIEGRMKIPAPSDRGLILYRAVIGPEGLEAAEESRRGFSCSRYPVPRP